MVVFYESFKIGYTLDCDYTPYSYILKKAREGNKIISISKIILHLLYNNAFITEDNLILSGYKITIRD